MLTPTEISSATGDALGRLGVRVQDASLEDQKYTNQKFEDFMVAEAARHASLQAVVERIAVAAEKQAATGLNKKQQAFFDLYSTHLKTRRDPAVITSATGDAIVKDIALDAMMMTNEVWPLFKQAMASMEVPPGGVDWS